MVYYHLSKIPGLTELIPRIPECAVGINENITTARVCFAPSISGCLSALQDLDGFWYVYKITDESTEIYTPTPEEVIDQKVTGEVWVLTPVKVTYLGKITSKYRCHLQEVKVKRFGKYDYCHFHKYEWQWCTE